MPAYAARQGRGSGYREAVELAGQVIGSLVGVALVMFARHQFRTRPALVRRREAHRNLLGGGTLLLFIGATACFVGIAAATSGHPADQDDAVVLLGLGLALGAAGTALLVCWWVLAGRRTAR